MENFSLIPESLTSLSYFFLINISFFTSMLTVSVGIGGGTVLLAVMAQLIPVNALIPVHGVVQLGSNAGRVLVLWKYINWSMMGWFVVGSLLGAFVGGQIVVALPVTTLKIVLGGFILYSVWGPALASKNASNQRLGIGGFLSTVLTMFVGATGPFVLAILRAFSISRQMLVSTTAACLVAQHAIKVVVFGFLGFAFAPYFPLIVLMIVSGFCGTIVGRKMLFKVNENRFKSGLNIVLTILAIKLLIDAWMG